MGKTSLATNIAYNIAQAYQIRRTEGRRDLKTVNGGVVGFFSLEMSAEQLATRIISEQAEISSSKIRRGDITEAEFEKAGGMRHSTMQSVPLHVDQTGGISIASLVAKARQAQAATRAGPAGG